MARDTTNLVAQKVPHAEGKAGTDRVCLRRVLPYIQGPLRQIYSAKPCLNFVWHPQDVSSLPMVFWRSRKANRLLEGLWMRERREMKDRWVTAGAWKGTESRSVYLNNDQFPRVFPALSI